MLIISLFEIIYLYYMFQIFETRYAFTSPWEKFQLNYLNESVSERIFSYLKHPTTTTAFPESKICPFGKKIIYLLLIFLIARNIIFINQFKFLVLTITFSLSLSNLNALLYLTPYFLIELFLVS